MESYKNKIYYNGWKVLYNKICINKSLNVPLEKFIDNFKTSVRPNIGLRATESAGLTESERERERKREKKREKERKRA